MNSSNNLTLEEKIDEILFNFSNSGDYIAMGLIESRYKIVSEKAKQQLLSLLSEEKIKELEMMKQDWGYGEYPLSDPRHGWDWEDYINHRLQALKQESKK